MIEVSEKATSLDPVDEVAEVQRMINATNAAIRSGTAPARLKPLHITRTVFYTGYLIAPTDTDRLLEVCNIPTSDNDTRTLANNVMITPRPCPPHILERVGGLGKRQRWRVTHTGSLDNRICAARVEPVPANAHVYTDSRPPYVLLALRSHVRPAEAGRIKNWTALAAGRVFEFDSTVGEKAVLRIEEEMPAPPSGPAQASATHASGNTNDTRHAKRFKQHDADFPALGAQPPAGPQSQQRQGQGNGQQDGGRRQGGPGQPRHDRNRNGNGRGGGSGGGGRNGRGGGHGRGGGVGGAGVGGRARHRGGYASYRSLDDQVAGGRGGGGGGGGHGYEGANDGGAGGSGLTY